MNETELERVYKCLIQPRVSKVYSDRGLVNIDNGCQGGTHSVCFTIKDNKSFYYNSFGGQPVKFLLNQLPKRIIYHICKIQDNSSRLCGLHFLYLFYLIERKS